MKRIKFISALAFALFISFQTYAQTTISGSVEVGNLQSLQLTYNQTAPIRISEMNEYIYGKTIPAYCKIRIIANNNWRLMAALDDSFVKRKFPEGMVSLRIDGYTDFISIGNLPTELFYNHNKQIENNYTITVRVQPGLITLDELNNINMYFSLETY